MSMKIRNLMQKLVILLYSLRGCLMFCNVKGVNVNNEAMFSPDNEGEAPLLEPYIRVLYPESLCASCKGGVGL